VKKASGKVVLEVLPGFTCSVERNMLPLSFAMHSMELVPATGKRRIRNPRAWSLPAVQADWASGFVHPAGNKGLFAFLWLVSVLPATILTNICVS
jgi:hypothetical protein